MKLVFSVLISLGLTTSVVYAGSTCDLEAMNNKICKALVTTVELGNVDAIRAILNSELVKRPCDAAYAVAINLGNIDILRSLSNFVDIKDCGLLLKSAVKIGNVDVIRVITNKCKDQTNAKWK